MQRRVGKPIVSAVVVSLLSLSILSACSNDSNNASPGSSGAASGDATQKTGHKVRIIVGGNVQEFPDGVTKDDNFIMDYWREKSGDDIEFTILPLDGQQEKLNSMLVSGEADGSIIMLGGTEWIANLVNQDSLVALDDYIKGTDLATKYANVQSAGNVNGKQYGFVIPNAIGAQATSYLVRKDWMDQDGIAAQPKTFDEFNNMLKAFKEKNGKDAVPLGVYGSPNGWDFSPIKGLFGVPTEFAVRDGQVVYNPITDEYKQYLQYAHQLYEDGMIPKDFSMLNAQKLQEMFIGNKVGLLALDYPWGAKTIIPTVDQSGGDVRYMDFPTGANGQTSYGASYSPIGTAVAISGGGSDEDVKAAVDFIQFLLQPDTQKITNYGIEGQHYTEDNGNIVPTEEGKNIAWSVYFKQLSPPEEWYQMYGVMADWAEYYYPIERNSVKDDVDPTLFMPPQPELVSTKAQLDTKVDAFTTAVVMGKKTVDDFEAFKADWLKSGGQAILDGYNQLYQSLGSPTFKYDQYPPGDGYTGKYLYDGHK